MTPYLQQLENTIQPLVTQIAEHQAFKAIITIENLRRFSEIHVLCVYDFMCLIKALQRQLTCLNLLWLPPQNTLGCHLINHLVSEEESDAILEPLAGTERYLSHFTLYLEAMEQCGANTQPITRFLAEITEGVPLPIILTRDYIPAAAKSFVADTFKVINKSETHAIATAFAFARENITDDMFTPIVQNLAQNVEAGQVAKFITYFNRHIELDTGEHGEQAKRLVASLCGDDLVKWDQATQTAVFALKSRIHLLNGIYATMA
ncbi:MAG: DUF3050 domain-containing protein [Gammaproteobacteria bacterium]